MANPGTIEETLGPLLLEVVAVAGFVIVAGTGGVDVFAGVAVTDCDVLATQREPDEDPG